MYVFLKVARYTEAKQSYGTQRLPVWMTSMLGHTVTLRNHRHDLWMPMMRQNNRCLWEDISSLVNVIVFFFFLPDCQYLRNISLRSIWAVLILNKSIAVRVFYVNGINSNNMYLSFWKRVCMRFVCKAFLFW